MMTNLTVERRATSALDPRERRAIVELALRCTGLASARAYVEARFERYETIALASSAGRLEASLFVTETATDRGTLVYVGPAFSSGGAYAVAFGALVTGRLSQAEPFAVAMEIESASVLRALRHILPTYAYPKLGELPPERVRRRAEEMLSRVPHLVGFDPLTMTTSVVEPLRADRGSPASRYVLGFVPCDGAAEERDAISSELRQGVRAFTRRFTRRRPECRP